MSVFTVEACGLELTWHEQELAWTVRQGREVWRTAASHDDLALATTMSLRDASVVTTRRVSGGAFEGFTCALSGFAGQAGGLAITLSIVIETATGDLVASVDAEEAGGGIQSLWWPGPVRFETPGDQETVFPLMQGMLLPGTWPHAWGAKELTVNHRLFYMPWWGQRRGAAGYVGIIEHDADAGCRLEHPAGGPTSVGPRWDASLGRLRYARRVRYRFFDRCDYVSMCKHYRAHVKRRGRFVSLREKIAARPALAGLIGAPVIHEGISYHIHPASDYYNKLGANDWCVPFSERARQLRALKARGVARAYLHLDGWGVKGYDRAHPDYLPPNEEAGGWEGMRALSETCRELGYLLALHDQYRDYYKDAVSFSPDNALHDAAGQIPEQARWFGGPQSALCTMLAPAYVLRNHRQLQERGVLVDGTYLDVFAARIPDECFHPWHRMSRRDCLEARVRCFAIIRDLEGIVSSEEPLDFALPHLDLTHYGPYVIMELFLSKEDVQPPVAPLWNLVYHDALFIPWSIGAVTWSDGIPAGHAPAAHAALHGGMPYLSIEPTDDELARVKAHTDLHARVALEEMVSHAFLNEARTLQRAVYANGVSITADVVKGTWDIQ
ncbi:MAG: hypothetical protein K8T26_17510 [Lentisphaerae bacterium]|nr:hypothetical protein [Lentisphaerota bacterium]